MLIKTSLAAAAFRLVLVQGGIGRRIDDAEDHALILGWGQLLG
jgi:hypothetical protein